MKLMNQRTESKTIKAQSSQFTHCSNDLKNIIPITSFSAKHAANAVFVSNAMFKTMVKAYVH
jgi:hypothetical protein